jgi:hypothetical protein
MKALYSNYGEVTIPQVSAMAYVALYDPKITRSNESLREDSPEEVLLFPHIL